MILISIRLFHTQNLFQKSSAYAFLSFISHYSYRAKLPCSSSARNSTVELYPVLNREIPPITVIISLLSIIKFSSMFSLETVISTTLITIWSSVITRTVSLVIFFSYYFLAFFRISSLSLCRKLNQFYIFSFKFNISCTKNP